MDKNGNLERGDICHICGDYRCGIEGNMCEFLGKFNDLIDLSKNTRPQGEWGKWIIAEIQCPNCFEYFETDCYSAGELYKCPNCGTDMRKPNCVRCDHFGKCDGCEKGEEE